MLTTGAGTLAGAFDNTEMDYYLSADDSKDAMTHVESVRSRAMTHAAGTDSAESACAYSCIWLLMFGTNHYCRHGPHGLHFLPTDADASLQT